MADAIGLEGIHNVKGKCDLCGRVCDPLAEELNALDCTYKDCPPLLYHQDCLEKYLKSIRLEKNRKTGFKCPRGCGKGSEYTEACPGKIDKSHPIHPRNDGGKKRRKAKPPPEPAHKGKPGSKKDTKEKAKETPTKKEKETKKDKLKDKPKSVSIKALNVSNLSLVKSVGKASCLGRSPTSSRELTPRKSDSKKSLSSTSSSTPSSATHEPQEGPRQGPPPQMLHSAWSRPIPGVSQPQVPDINSMTAFPPPGGIPAPNRQEDPKPVVRSSSSSFSWSNVSSHRSPHLRSASVSDAAIALKTAGSVTQTGGRTSGSSELPVGMDYADAKVEEVKLTKTQRKNMKRAERKKKAQAVVEKEVSRSPRSQKSTEPSDNGSLEKVSDESRDPDDIVRDLWLETLAAWKTMLHIQQLQKLGFEHWQCVAAVQRFGSDLQQAVTWLLEGNIVFEEDFGSTIDLAVVPEVDVSDEVSQLREIQDFFSVGEKEMQEAVVSCNGDFMAALSVLLESKAETKLVDGGGGGGGAFSGGEFLKDAHSEGSEKDHQNVVVGAGDVQSPTLQTVRSFAPVEPLRSESFTEELMLGGVLGSKLDEYKSGKMDFTTLASKDLAASLNAPSKLGHHDPPDPIVLPRKHPTDLGTSPPPGMAMMGLSTPMYGFGSNPSSQGLAPNPFDSVVRDVGHYNRILGEAEYGMPKSQMMVDPMRYPSEPIQYAIPHSGSWGLDRSHTSELDRVVQEDQQDWRHYIGNLLEG